MPRAKPAEPLVQFPLRIPASWVGRLKAAADKQGQSSNAYAMDAIRCILESDEEPSPSGRPSAPPPKDEDEPVRTVMAPISSDMRAEPGVSAPRPTDSTWICKACGKQHAIYASCSSRSRR